jgi:hypothetical protein
MNHVPPQRKINENRREENKIKSPLFLLSSPLRLHTTKQTKQAKQTKQTKHQGQNKERNLKWFPPHVCLILLQVPSKYRSTGRWGSVCSVIM